MGLYLNSDEPLAMYKKIVNSPYFVDKSKIIAELNMLLDTSSAYVCITRPRRFGKSAVANMVGAYYSKACDASAVFGNLMISGMHDYGTHLNNYNVISIDFSEVEYNCTCFDDYMQNIINILREDLRDTYPDVPFREQSAIWEDLRRISQKTGEQFIFIFDEWDAVFHMPFISDEDKKKYLTFLKILLKGKGYVSLVYMTGILPIAKYSSGSELNMFDEYTMVSNEKYGAYFGFTEHEVNTIYQKYVMTVKNPKVSRAGLKLWYNGYQSMTGELLYNPRSVVLALMNNQLGDYWTSSGPYDEIYYYIEHNIEGVKDDIALMVAGEAVPAKVQEYSATATTLETRDEILSAMIVYGFLTSKDDMVRIPNKELMDKFADMVKKKSALGYVYKLARESDRMLAATLAGDTQTVVRILQQAHDTETGMKGYNNETELSASVRLVYLSARDRYDVLREDKAGVGYVDYIFIPKVDNRDDCIILELKIDHTADEAISQIKDRNYMQRFLGKLGERAIYSGRIIAVGIAYQKSDTAKKHECKIEILRDRL